MRLLARGTIAACALVVLLIGWHVVAQTPATAEALGQANLRAAPSVDADLVGQISAGTRYPIIGRSALFPWVLIADPVSSAPLGWVFRDLVAIVGDVNAVTITEDAINAPPPIPTPTISILGAPDAPPDAAAAPEVAYIIVNGVPFEVTLTPTPAALVTGIVLGEINIRYGPGVEYERLGVGRVGDRFAVIARHTQFEWVQIRYDASPVGTAWVSQGLLEYEGDLNALPAISTTAFNLRTLTPTPSNIRAAAVRGQTAEPSAGFRELAESINQLMLAGRFDQATSRLGAFFLMDLQTGEAFSLGEDIAFSGMSLNKIAIFIALFSRINEAPNDATAVTIAESMVCSENISSNRMLAIMGDGNPYRGAEEVSAFLERIGLTRTFIFTPFANDPFITPQAPRTRVSGADQRSAGPDPFNQLTVSEMGTLLSDVYQCAYNERGALLDPALEGAFTPNECRKIMEVMRYNEIGNFIEAGVPDIAQVSHKHGWINDTHGDAGVIFTPGGDYVFVIALRNPGWMEFFESSAIIEESSRLIYNYFNPDAPLDTLRDVLVPATCSSLGSPAIDILLRRGD